MIQEIQSSVCKAVPPKLVFQKWVIKRSNHYAYLGGHYFIISFWLTPLHVLLIRSIQQCHRMDLITTLAKVTASLSLKAKLRVRLLVTSGRLLPSPEIQVSTDKDILISRGRAGLEASYLSPISPPLLLLVR